MRVSRLWLVLALLVAQAARGDPLQHEFLLLPSAVVIGTFDREAPQTQIYDQVVQADALLSLQKGPVKLFAEYLVSDHEGDLERAQLGWQLSSDTILWVGRFHQPSSVWNHEHHHGQYLQTSISRPWIEEWEDLRGPLPQHFTGALLESTHSLAGGWRLRTSIAGGIAPKLTNDGLEPFDLVHPDSHHRMGYQVRTSIHPDEFSESGVGLLLALDQIAVDGLAGRIPYAGGLDHVDLQLIGAFGTYAGEGWKLNGTVYRARTDLHYPFASTVSDSFWVGYIAAERRVMRDLTGFVRFEEAGSTGDSPYLRLFEQFVRTRYLGGIRWDFLERQALTLQVTKSQVLNGHFSDVRLQWSAALF